MTPPDPRLLRAIDANLNRANEALRVIEDCLRFVIEDAHLTSICKGLRHRLGVWAQQLDRHACIRMRNAADDVGRGSQVESEYYRSHVWDVLAANTQRVEQALRALEEFAKTITPQLAQDIERLRYDVYQFEIPLSALQKNQQTLRRANLYVLTDTGGDISLFQEKLEALVAAQVDLIQLRAKSLSDKQLVRFAETLSEVTRSTRTLSIINDRVDLALAVGASGVHLGQDDLSMKAARQIAGPELLIGISTHCLTQARQAVLDGADYIGVGPTFPSTTKQFQDFTGLSFLREVAQEITLPAFAIGGINLQNAKQVGESGVTRIAVSAAVPDAPEQVAGVIQQLRNELESVAER